MALIKAKALIEGKEADVELDDEKFISIDTHNQRLQHTVQERLARKEAEVRGNLEKDDEFWNKLVKVRGFDPQTKTELDGVAAERLRNEIRTAEVEPLKTRLTEREKFSERLLDKTKRAELKAAFARVAKEGLVDLLVERYQRDLHYELKSGAFALKDANGEWVFATNTNNGTTPYRGIGEVVEQWAKDPVNKEFLATPAKQGGAGVGKEGIGSSADEMKDMSPLARINLARSKGMK